MNIVMMFWGFIGGIIGFSVYPLLENHSKKNKISKIVSQKIQMLSPKRKKAFNKVYGDICLTSLADENLNKYVVYLHVLVCPESEIDNVLNSSQNSRDWMKKSSCAVCIRAYLLRDRGDYHSMSLNDFGFTPLGKIIEEMIFNAEVNHSLLGNPLTDNHVSDRELEAILSNAKHSVVDKAIYDEDYNLYGFIKIETKYISSLSPGEIVPIFLKMTLPPPFHTVQILGKTIDKDLVFSLIYLEENVPDIVGTVAKFLKDDIKSLR